MKFRAMLAALTVAAIGAPFGQGQAATELEVEYFPSTDGYNLCDKEHFPPEVGPTNPTGINIGAVCPVVATGKKVRVVDIADDLSAEVSFSFYWLDARGNYVGSPSLVKDPEGYANYSPEHRGRGCSSTPWLEAPPGAKYFYMFLHGAALTVNAGNCDAGYYASHGFVHFEIANA